MGNYQAKSIFSIGEKLYENVRNRAEKAFGSRITDVYGANELGRIAISCPQGEGFHCHDSNVLLEVVSENSQPVGEGEIG